MLKLPKATEVSKQLAKKAIYGKFSLTTAEKERFDESVKKLTIVNEILPSSINLAESENLPAFYVVEVSLKQKDYDAAIVEKILKLINQKMIWVLEFENDAQIMVLHGKLIRSPWQAKESLEIKLKGLNISQAWESVVQQIGNVQIEQGKTLDEQLAINEARSKLQKQIDALKKKAWAEKQPKKKFAYAQELKVLERQLEEL